ncbi:MAG: hypothetical protein HY301_05135 [Verrucomicrobia bacterium]|nr:hypothetical protein [Verrucomicrobiota bacterium]
MNPFGIVQAIGVAIEAAAHAIIPRKWRPKETRRERGSFWVLYALLMLLGIGTVIWVVCGLYFSK